MLSTCLLYHTTKLKHAILIKETYERTESMEYTFENETVKLVVSEHAAEIISLYHKESNIEHMWQADPTYWKGRNPICFPIVGKVYDGNIRIDDAIYHMGNHGFARHATFTCVAKSENSITLELKDSEETLAQYPFHFILQVTYTLVGNEVKMEYRVTNTNDRTMPFNFGMHPAFNVPLCSKESFTDYVLKIDCKNDIDGTNIEVDQDGDVCLGYDALEQTIIFKDPNSTTFTLTTKDNVHGTCVKATNFPWIAIWSPSAPFVCIEPWYSHTDFEENPCLFEQREGTLFLEPNDTWTTSYSISIY